jgi:hypothetical protein
MNFAYALEDHGLIRKQKHDKDIKFVGAAGTYVASKTMLKHSQGHQNDKKTTRPWICHHGKRKGHIRPLCYKLYGYPQSHVQPKVSGMIAQARKEWRPKTPNVSSSVTSSVSISVPPVLTKSGNLVQSSLNVVDVDKSVYLSAFKTAIALNVASDVTTSLVQPDKIKFVAELASNNEMSQSKKVSDLEDGNFLSVGDENDGSESDGQSVWSLLLF